MKQYFMCCDNCGGIEWLDYDDIGNNILNYLLSDGSTVFKLDLDKSSTDNFLCSGCEKPLNPILFTEVSKSFRIKIYNMNPEDRVNWAKGFWTIKQLKELNEKEEDL